MTKSNCPGTDYMSHDDARDAGHLPPELRDTNTYGRMCCTTCHGFVLTKVDGTLRRHVAGSNGFTAADRVKIADMAARGVL